MRQGWRPERGEEDEREAFGSWKEAFTRGEMAGVAIVIMLYL